MSSSDLFHTGATELYWQFPITRANL